MGFPLLCTVMPGKLRTAQPCLGDTLVCPPQTALFPWDLIWAVPLVYSPNQKDLEEEIKAFPATTVLGLGYNGASAPECVQGVRCVAQDDVRPVCLHPTCGTEHRCV